MRLARCSLALTAAAVSLLDPAQLASQHLPGSAELGWPVLVNDRATAATPLQLIRWTVAKSPRRALVFSVAGTVLPIAAGAVLFATRPRTNPISGEPADETYDVVSGILIGAGLGLGPSLGHFYAHEMGWFWPRVLVGGVLGLVAAGSDLESGVGLALLGATAVTVMAARDIATAPAAAKRYNARKVGLALGLDLARREGRLGLRWALR